MDIQTKAILTLVKHDLSAAHDNKLPLEQRIYRVTNALGTLLNLFEQPTTVEPTQTAPTTEEPSVAEEPTYLVTRQSSPSAPVDTGSGLVEQISECVHSWTWVAEGLNKWVVLWCQRCGVLKDNDRIRVPAVAKTSSTSVKQPSNESVENSVEESAKSQLNLNPDFQKLWARAVEEFGPGWGNRVIREMEE